MTDKFTPAQMTRFREFLRWFCKTTLAPLHRELVIKSSVINMLKAAYPDRSPTEPLAPTIDAALAYVQAKPEFQTAIQLEFQQFQERLIQSIPEGGPDSESENMKWLRDWKPTGLLN